MAALNRDPIDEPDGTGLRLSLNDGLPLQGYHLEIKENGLFLQGADEPGLFYGLQTLRQWIGLHQGSDSIEGVVMEDAPHFPNRGVMLDVSRSKMPSMSSLHELIDLLAGLKINQIQLYIEHVFAYEGHETVWRDASPLTGSEIRALDRHCQERFIELVPNQNSFGHFHRWLIHGDYRPLAECPEGVSHPFSRDIEPFSLCPTDPRSLDLLSDLYSQLLPHFTSNLFNVGLDETLDLGMGRSKELCEEQGREVVYLQFLEQVHRLVSSFGKRMQFWGDIIINRPDLIQALPKEAIALEWGYEADHPFEEHAACFAASGLEFYVCPGTSGWSSILGRTTNALANLESAARHGQASGASGYLITDWGDFGHLQPLPVSYPGFLAGAMRAWNAEAAFSQQDLADALDRYVFRDGAGGMGQILCDLGNAYLEAQAPATNGSAMFFTLRFADETMDHPRLAGLNGEGVARTRKYLEGLGRPWRRSNYYDHERVARELDWAMDLALWNCDFAAARFEHGPKEPVSRVPGPSATSWPMPWMLLFKNIALFGFSEIDQAA